MEHFFNRRPTKGYTEYVESEDRENGITRGEDVTVPYHISKAACYVEDARDGRLANGKGKMSDMTHKIQLCFFIQTHTWWSRFIYICIVFMSLLVFFEPSSSAAITVCNCGLFNFDNGKSICRKELIVSWEAWTLFIEILMIAVFISDVLMKQAYMKPHVYWTKKWHKISGFFILLFIFDWTIFVFSYSITQSGLRFSRPFRPILLLTRYRELRRILETLLSMKKDLIRQIATIIVYIVIFAWVGVSLFDDTYRFTKDCVDKNYGDVREQLNKSASYCVEKPCWNTTRDYFCLCGHEQWNSTQTGCDYISDDIPFKNHYLPEDYAAFNNSFSNILYGTVRLMVHLSTENYPDFILPAFKRLNTSAVYFILFMFIGMFLLMSVLLAVIVEFWLTYLKKTNDNEKRKERLGITKAFAWIDVERNYFIDEESWNQLILLLKKDFTKTQSQFMFDMLDWEDKGYLDVLDFLNITEALTLHYNVRNMATSIENSRYGALARKILGFKCVFNCAGLIKKKTLDIAKIAFSIVVLHTFLALICLPSRPLNIVNDLARVSLRAINSFLLFVLVIEQALRLLSKGFYSYLQNLTNRWEIVTVTAAFVSMIAFWITFFLTEGGTQNDTMITVMNIFRMVWELLIILRPSISGAIIIFFYKVINVLAELFFFIIIIVYVFMVIGLELFAIHSNASEENYYQQYGCGIGFVTPTCASMTMWQQITTSNWHDIMNSVAQASGFWAYAYFCIFYIVINLVLLDLTIAMTIEMYNAIKSQYFTSKSSEEEGDSEGVVFQIQTQDTYFRHEQVTEGGLIERGYRKKSSAACFGLGLQVTKSSGGSWRKSVLDNDAGKISMEDLDKIQKSVEGEKIGHGKDKGKLYMNSKDDINVRQMYGEKLNEAKNLDQPECTLHFWFPILNYLGEEVGEIVMEMKDHHSHDCNVKLNFNSGDPCLRPNNAEIYSIVNDEEQIYVSNFSFMSVTEHELINTDYEHHGFQKVHWTIKKSQRIQLKKDNIRVRIFLDDITNLDQSDFLQLLEEAPKRILTAHITGYEEERKRWDDKQKEIKQTRKLFGDVSYLLQKNAYRVSTRKMSWGSEEVKEDGEKGKQSDKRQRAIYFMEKENVEKEQNKAYLAWRRALTIERSAAKQRKEEAKGAIMKAVRRASLIAGLSKEPTRNRILSGDAAAPSSSGKKLPTLLGFTNRSKSLADIMMGAAKNPESKSKLDALAESVKSGNAGPSRSPRRSTPEEDPLEKYRKLVEARRQRNVEEQKESSDDEIHSDDSDDDGKKKDSDDSTESDESTDSDNSKAVEKKKSLSSSTGSIYDKIKQSLSIKSKKSPSPSPTNLQPPGTPSDPQTSPKNGLDVDPLLKVPLEKGAARSFPTTPEPKAKDMFMSKIKRAISRPAMSSPALATQNGTNSQPGGLGLTVVITDPDENQFTDEGEGNARSPVIRSHSAPNTPVLDTLT
ncbi:hypothetical protein ACHWQZ_G011297 [Mnemiopsis leidyi]